jgi:predicted Zn-dependent protease
MRRKETIAWLLGWGAGLAAMLVLVVSSPQRAQAQFGGLSKVLNKAQQVHEATKPLTLEEEQGVGRDVAAKLVANYHIYKNEALNRYVNMVGETVAAQSERQDISYHFAVLDTDEIDAFSAPGGYIFITRGALKLCDDESELAGVLAHEVGHVAAKHVVHVIEHDKMLRAGEQEASSHMNTGKLNDYFNKLAGAALVKIVDQGLAPADEYDADARGVKYAYEAGYSADGLERFLTKLDQATQQGGKSFWTRTHPPVPQRNARIQELIASQKWQDAGRPKLQERFEAATKMLRTKAGA